jgi:hypothetical protein
VPPLRQVAVALQASTFEYVAKLANNTASTPIFLSFCFIAVKILGLNIKLTAANRKKKKITFANFSHHFFHFYAKINQKYAFFSTTTPRGSADELFGANCF